MDDRNETFARRFTEARKHLLAPDVQGIVSIKFRDDCVGYSTYDHLADDLLHREMGLEVQPLHRAFGGRAWLVMDRNQSRAILVEHETGLEILGAIGSVASLIGLVPMVGWAWARLRDRFGGRHHHPSQSSVEIRRVNQDGVLVEEHAPSIEIYVLNVTLQEQSELRKRIADLECKVETLKSLPPKSKPRSRKRKPKKA
jgi:hypothetical protein